MKTNKNRLVTISVIGEVASPTRPRNLRITHEGIPTVYPGTGGITYNVKIGDPVFGWIGDHIEPGVSIKNKDENENRALQLYTCIGNEVRVTGRSEAQGKKGIVTGKHGGIEHILVCFENNTLEKLAIGDKVQVKACGQGFEITELPQVKFYNLAPNLFLKIEAKVKNGFLEFPVTQIIPPECMGSGLGSETAASGDYDITTQDSKSAAKFKNLRLGDFVFLKDTDNTFGRCMKKGSCSVGIVVHANCIGAGHGPGVTTVATSLNGKIKPVLTKNANIADYLEINK